MNPRNFLVLACCCGGLTGQQPSVTQAAPPESPVAPVSRPAMREATDYVDFTGRAEAVASVNMIARVSGYLVKEPFQEARRSRPAICCSRSIPGPTRPNTTKPSRR